MLMIFTIITNYPFPSVPRITLFFIIQLPNSTRHSTCAV